MNLIKAKSALVVTDPFHIAVNDFDGKKSAFCERMLVT